jgi:uncharacterized protein YcaQ
LRAEGPLTTKQLGGGRRGGEWWDWSDVKVAVEWLLDIGEVVCVRREGWRRVYDLAERAIPAPLLAADPDDESCLRGLVAAAGRVLGVGTRADLAEVHRLRGEQVDAVVAETGLVPLRSRAGTRRPGRTQRRSTRWPRRAVRGTARRSCRPSTR